MPLSLQTPGLWQDALRLAQEYLPHKVEEIQRAYEAQRGSSTASNDVLAQVSQAVDFASC